ncbi:MAG TPA: DNA repair protein RecO [Spirochaetota bacterium]|nr:DNA repair protein RecO [Spirochaetota bacterium]HOM39173.1 DNA repair protein RecO [Spirochaetota bacterium]HPQ50027.1 DNA repair protein RecO [Spirochaetota bacterium]
MDNLEISCYIISEKEYKDNHKIFTIFTENHGVMEVICYGVRSYKSRFNKLGVLIKSLIKLKKNKKGIFFIDDFRIIEDYRLLDYALLWEIIYFFKFLKVLEFETEEENSFVYNMLSKMIDLCKHKNTNFFRVISTSFILKTLVYLKIIYFSDKCSQCHKKSNNFFLGDDAEIYCTDCKRYDFIKISDKDYSNFYKLIYLKFEDINIDNNEINYFLIDKILKTKIRKSIYDFRPAKNPFST